MVVIANKRSVMTVYSGEMDLYSHRTRIVLAEKGVSVNIINIKDDVIPEDLVDVNPYNSVPTLVDRDLVLYQSDIIMEYLDERFPHPPLLPVYPVAKARFRLMMYRINQDWYPLVQRIERDEDAALARRDLLDSLTSLLPVFGDTPFFMSEDFSLVDCCIAPLLWRLPRLGIELPSNAKAITDYMDRVFKRDSFQASMTESEREIREEAFY